MPERIINRVAVLKKEIQEQQTEIMDLTEMQNAYALGAISTPYITLRIARLKDIKAANIHELNTIMEDLQDEGFDVMPIAYGGMY